MFSGLSFGQTRMDRCSRFGTGKVSISLGDIVIDYGFLIMLYIGRGFHLHIVAWYIADLNFAIFVGAKENPENNYMKPKKWAVIYTKTPQCPEQ